MFWNIAVNLRVFWGGGLKMNILNICGYSVGILVFAILVLLSMLNGSNQELKEKRKDYNDALDSNDILRKKIDDLEEKLQIYKNMYDVSEMTIKELTEYPEENNNLKDESSK